MFRGRPSTVQAHLLRSHRATFVNREYKLEACLHLPCTHVQRDQKSSANAHTPQISVKELKEPTESAHLAMQNFPTSKQILAYVAFTWLPVCRSFCAANLQGGRHARRDRPLTKAQQWRLLAFVPQPSHFPRRDPRKEARSSV